MAIRLHPCNTGGFAIVIEYWLAPADLFCLIILNEVLFFLLIPFHY